VGITVSNGLTSITSLAEPCDEISFKDLSPQQRKVIDIVEKNRQFYEHFGVTIKHGVIIVGSWGSGKSQTLRTAIREGILPEKCAFERGRIYSWVSKDIDIRKTETKRRILESLVKLAKSSEFPILALDNPDVPTGSYVSVRGALNFTRWILEEATFGKTPYLVITLNDFTYKVLESEPTIIAKIAQHFDVIHLIWNSEELKKALKARLQILGARTNIPDEVLTTVSEITTVPRSAIFLTVKLLVGTRRTAINKEQLIRLLSIEGLRPAFEEYIRLLSRPGYRLTKAHGRDKPIPRWIEIWNGILNVDDNYLVADEGILFPSKEKITLIYKLIKGKAAARDFTRLAKLGGYKVPHWLTNPPLKYCILVREVPGYFKFTDEFLSAATDRAAGLESTAKDVLRNMAELYGKIKKET